MSPRRFDSLWKFFAGAIAMCLTLSSHAVVYVSHNGNGTTGDSWENALHSVGDAVLQASVTDEVWIAEGTYTDEIFASLLFNTRIYGGFPSTGNPGFGDRDPKQFETILDGQGTLGNIFLISGVGLVVVDGLTFTGASGAGPGFQNGGAINIATTMGGIQIRNCRFEANTLQGSAAGGGVNIFGDSTVTIEDCTFHNNYAYEGGGVKVHESTLIMRRCVFTQSGAEVKGAALSAYLSDTEVTECQFIGGSSHKGGGAECHEGTRAIFTNCLFARNTAETHGAALNFEFQDGIKIINSTFYDNATPQRGGGVFLHESPAEINNSIFVKNQRHAIYENSTSTDPVTNNNLFFDNPHGVYYDEDSTSIAQATGDNGLNALVAEAAGNLDGDPLFADADNNDFRIMEGSPAIDAGIATDAPVVDFEGETRPIDVPGVGQDGAGAGFDIGFDEFDPANPPCPTCSGVLGDVNDDTQVDAVDVQFTINSALGIVTPYDCDVNDDASVDAVDVQTVINAALGL